VLVIMAGCEKYIATKEIASMNDITKEIASMNDIIEHTRVQTRSQMNDPPCIANYGTLKLPTSHRKIVINCAPSNCISS
jgi:hypothetical protein